VRGKKEEGYKKMLQASHSTAPPVLVHEILPYFHSLASLLPIWFDFNIIYLARKQIIIIVISPPIQGKERIY